MILAHGFVHVPLIGAPSVCVELPRFYVSSPQAALLLTRIDGALAADDGWKSAVLTPIVDAVLVGKESGGKIARLIWECPRIMQLFPAVLARFVGDLNERNWGIVQKLLALRPSFRVRAPKSLRRWDRFQVLMRSRKHIDEGLSAHTAAGETIDYLDEADKIYAEIASEEDGQTFAMHYSKKTALSRQVKKSIERLKKSALTFHIPRFTCGAHIGAKGLQEVATTIGDWSGFSVADLTHVRPGQVLSPIQASAVRVSVPAGSEVHVVGADSERVFVSIQPKP